MRHISRTTRHTMLVSMRRGQLWVVDDPSVFIEVVPPLTHSPQGTSSNLEVSFIDSFRPSAHLTKSPTSHPRTFVVLSNNVGLPAEIYKKFKILLGGQIVVFHVSENCDLLFDVPSIASLRLIDSGA